MFNKVFVKVVLYTKHWGFKALDVILTINEFSLYTHDKKVMYIYNY